MKISPFFCLAFFAFLPIASADLTIVQSIESKSGTNKATLKIKAERARIEINPKSGMIVDGKSGEVITLIYDQKAVLRVSGEKAKELGNKARAILKDTESSLEVVQPKPTGKKQTINGYEADEYVAETPQYRATYWVAKSYPDYQTILRQMKLLQNKTFLAVRKAMPDYYDFPGLPIRTKIKLEGQEEATTTLTSISQAPIADSEFAVPADYSEVKLPDFDLHKRTPTVPLAPAEEPGAQP